MVALRIRFRSASVWIVVGAVCLNILMACLIITVHAVSGYFKNPTDIIDLLNGEIFSGRNCSVLLLNTRVCVEDGAAWIIAMFVPSIAAVLSRNNFVRIGIILLLAISCLSLGLATIFVALNDGRTPSGMPAFAIAVAVVVIQLSLVIAVVGAAIRCCMLFRTLPRLIETK
jgi:hypothetical protein